jgi:methionyl-tRNA formyltransferase
MSSGRRLRALFMGSPGFAVPVLEALAEHHDVALVITQPDRPAGRGRVLTPPPVKALALARGFPVLQPTRLKPPSFAATLAALAPDVSVVAAYGRILPPAVLDVPRLGSWNVHASILPAWRGAAPIAWAIRSGDPETGVSIMRLDPGLDTGDVALVRRLAIRDDDTTGTLGPRLAALGAEALVEALARLAAGELPTTPQPPEGVTLAPPLTKADGHLALAAPARAVSCQARAMDPWPGAFVTRGDLVVKVFGPAVLPHAGPPGTVLGLDDAGLVVACGAGAVAFAELQLPGRRRLPAAAVVAGRGLALGDLLA